MKKIGYSVFLLFFTLFSINFFSCRADCSLTFFDEGFSEGENLIKKSRKDIDFYVFSHEQSKKIESFIEEKGSLALKITLEAKKVPENNKEKSLFGFLFPEDFSSSKLKKVIPKNRPAVSFDFAEFASGKFSVILSFPKNAFVPEGFFIKSSSSYRIFECNIVEPSLGFDFSTDKEEYAFCSNGGILKRGQKNIALSSVEFSFSTVNSFEDVMPSLFINFFENGKSCVILSGGEKITVRNGENLTSCIPLSSLKSPFSTLEFISGGENVSCAMVKKSSSQLLKTSTLDGISPVYPYKIDPGLIVKWPEKNWRSREYELFEWDRFEGILFFDIKDYALQDDFFKRLAFFVEKKGYRGKLLSDEFLNGKHGYNAHDYRAKDLALFFETAKKENFPLNQKECLLQEILLKNGVIVLNENGSITEGKGAVISISRESPDYLRNTFVAHEGWHGIYFVDEDFRNIVSSVYYSLMACDPLALEFLVRYFEVTPSLNYDTSDEYLLKNEFMAYMLQRPVTQIEKYYVDMAKRDHAQSKMKELADYIIETSAQSFAGSAGMLEDYVLSRWNLSGGRVWLLSR